MTIISLTAREVDPQTVAASLTAEARRVLIDPAGIESLDADDPVICGELRKNGILVLEPPYRVAQPLRLSGLGYAVRRHILEQSK